MADTIPDIGVNGADWTDLNDVSSIAAGTACEVTNNTQFATAETVIRVAIASSKPAADDNDIGIKLTTTAYPAHTYEFPSGENTIWAKCEGGAASGAVRIRAV